MKSAPHVLLWPRLLGLLEGYQARPVQRAYHLAVCAHGGQVRDGSDEPYIRHPLSVALILAEEMGKVETFLLCAALLHDVIEDSNIPIQEIQHACGTQVMQAVALLTKPLPEESKEQRDAAYYERLAEGPTLAQLVKCADRLDNLRSMQALGDEARLLRYIEETRRYILPIAAQADPYLYESLAALCEIAPSTV